MGRRAVSEEEGFAPPVMARPAHGNTNRTAGIIKRLTPKGYGFLKAANGTEYFFHNSAIDAHFDDLREGQPVTFDVTEGPKGPRAENVELS